MIRGVIFEIRSSVACLKPFGHIFSFLPDTKAVPTPNFCDLLFRIASANELQGDVKGLAGILPTLQTGPAFIEIRTDAHIINADEIHSMINVIDQLKLLFR